MKAPIVIFGANGFLGRYLCRHFALQEREVVAIARHREKSGGAGMFLEWDGKNPGPWALALEGAEAVINLTGATVNCRYTPANRRRILDSRVDSTRAIGEAVAGCRVPPKVWLNASTATWYRHAEDHPQDDWMGEHGEGFSCDVARAWEEAFYQAAVPPVTRKAALRTGMVLANEPGTVFDVIKRLATIGLGGTMGSGNQRISWIHMTDFLRAIDFIIADPFLDGSLNLTAPAFPANREWMRLFRNHGSLPFGLPAPRWILEIGARLLSTETELVLKSRWAKPLRLHDAGFHWQWPDPESAIGDLYHRPGIDAFFKKEQSRTIGAQAWKPASIHP